MLISPVIILVGGPSTGKSKFYTQFTTGSYYYPTVKITPNIALWVSPSFVIVDTPGIKQNRSTSEYSWQGVFRLADIILDFGNWSEDEIFGEKYKLNPKYMTWSGDNQETMKRIQEYLQGK
jgi:ribosome-interacting GTPase 1